MGRERHKIDDIVTITNTLEKPSSPPKYDPIGFCVKCGGENEIRVVDWIGYTPGEAETACQACGHLDYWAYGWFERREVSGWTT